VAAFFAVPLGFFAARFTVEAPRMARNRPPAQRCGRECQPYVTGIRHAWSVKRIERVRLYPTNRQWRRLHFMLDVTRELYNAMPDAGAQPVTQHDAV
jgi:hypothetical protein